MAKQKKKEKEILLTEMANTAPPFKNLTGKQVASVASKLAQAKTDGQWFAALEKTGLQLQERYQLLWHIARHGLIEPLSFSFRRFLAQSVTEANADDVFAVISRLAVGEVADLPQFMEVLPCWSAPDDAIVLRAMELDPARLEDLLATANPRLRLGIQLVRGRSGAKLEEQDRKALLEALAVRAATKDGLSAWRESNGVGLKVPCIGTDGIMTKSLGTVHELAAILGNEDEWAAALTNAARAGKFTTLEHVMPGLASMRLEDLVAALQRAELQRAHGPSIDRDYERIQRLLEARDDDPLLLARAVLSIEWGKFGGEDMRELLLLLATARMGALGISVPDGLEREVRWGQFIHTFVPWSDFGGSAVLRQAYRGAVEAIGRERAFALVRSKLEDPQKDRSFALPFLWVYYDEDMAQSLIAKIGSPEVLCLADNFGPLGKPAIQILNEAIAEASTEGKRRKLLEQALFAVLGYLGAMGESFDASLDRWVTCSPDEQYWQNRNRAIFLNALRAMPEERRAVNMERLFQETRQVERPFFGVQTVADSAFRERAARIVIKRAREISSWDVFREGLRALGLAGIDAFRPALIAEKPENTMLLQVLGQEFGHERVAAIVKETGTTEEGGFARLLRLAKSYLDSHPDIPRTRIYLLERPDLDPKVPSPKAGSFSRSGGAGPGGLVQEGTDEKHLLTVDLLETPELAKRYPNFRAISLWVSMLDEHEDGDVVRGRIVPVSETCSAPEDGLPVTVVPLDVPAMIFAVPQLASIRSSVSQRNAAERTAIEEFFSKRGYQFDEHNLGELADIRRLLFSRPGYVLGQPIYIQNHKDSDSNFIMQLHEEIGTLNLGDVGALYVFEHGVFMQSH